MSPFQVIKLFKKVITKNEGVIATYELTKNALIPVMVLPRIPTPDEIAKIREILK